MPSSSSTPSSTRAKSPSSTRAKSPSSTRAKSPSSTRAKSPSSSSTRAKSPSSSSTRAKSPPTPSTVSKPPSRGSRKSLASPSSLNIKTPSATNIISTPNLQQVNQLIPQEKKWIFTVPDPTLQVNGLHPIFLSTATVDLFHLKTLCTSDNPYTFLKRSDLVSDLFNRAAVSDFAPLKQQLQTIDLDEVLLVQDLEWSFGQNYLICLSDAATNAFLQLPKTPNEKTPNIADTAVSQKAKVPQSKVWISLGSDKEINDERVVPTRKPIYQHLSRKRRKFGQVVEFHDGDCTGNTIDVTSNPVITAKCQNLMQLNTGVQAVGPLNEVSCQTMCNRKVNSSVQYTPREFDAQTQAKHLDSDPLVQAISDACTKIEKVLRMNNTINIFKNQFVHLGEDDQALLDQGSHTSLLEYQSFTDLKYSKDKSISSVAWHPVQKGVLAVSCTQRLTLNERIYLGYRSNQSIVLIWSFFDPIHPQLILQAHEDVGVLKFHPQLTNILAGGCINGQLVVWDLSEYQDKLRDKQKDTRDANNPGKSSKSVEVQVVKPIAVSAIDHSHRTAICDICWTNTEVNYNGEIVKPTASIQQHNLDQPTVTISQLVSVGLDGNIMFWDLRYKKDLKSLDQTWRPIYKIAVSTKDMSFEYGLTHIALDSAAISYDTGDHGVTATTRVWCATEEGDVIQLDWVGGGRGDTTKSGDPGTNNRLDLVSSVHFGPVCEVLRSPMLCDLILSVGGWSCHIFSDLCNAPLISSVMGQVLLTCGAWSPTRPGVFYIGRGDGLLEIWDLLDGTNGPSQVQAVSSLALTAIRVHTYYAKGYPINQFIAAGDDEGTVHVLEVPRNLYRPRKTEKTLISALLDREIKRIAYTKEFKVLSQQMKQKGTVVDAVKEEVKGKEDPKSLVELEGDVLEKVYLELESSVLESLQSAVA